MRHISRVVIIVILLSLTYFILNQLSELKSVIIAFRSIRLMVLAPMFLCYVGWLDSQIRVYHRSLRTIGVTIPYADTFKTWLASFFVNVVVPSGSFAGISYLALQGHRWKISKVHMIVGSMIGLFASYISFIIIFFIASITQRIVTPYLTTVSIATITLGIVCILLLLGITLITSKLGLLVKLLKILRNLFNIGKKSKYQNDFFDSLEEASITLKKFKNRSHLILGPLGISLQGHVFGLALLYGSFLSLGYNIPFSALISGYIIGMLFTIVSITPAGLGLVEVTMPLVFSGFGISITTATAATLIFRIFSLWLVVFMGGYYFKHIEHLESKHVTLIS